MTHLIGPQYNRTSCNWANTPVGGSCLVRCQDGMSPVGTTASGYNLPAQWFQSTCQYVG
jgi:hypothetical protein